MATSKTQSAWDNAETFETPEPRQEKATSIVAHVVRSISVTMSAAEMDVLVGTFGRSRDELSRGELDVLDEFTREVETVRFH